MIEIFAQFIMKSILVMIFVLPFWLVFLTYTMPKKVIDRYLCPPHFSIYESKVYTCFPSNLSFANILCFAIAIPFARRFRFLENINKEVPVWFNIASRFYVYIILGYTLFCILAMVTLSILIEQGFL